jgi:hypothetical protein
METLLEITISSGTAEEVADILGNNPGLDINWRNGLGWTPLHIAELNNRPEVVRMLLDHPGVDVNATTVEGRTVFMEACIDKHVEIAKMLIDDPRTDLNRADNAGRLPLVLAAWGSSEVVLWWLASGRELNLGQEGNIDTDAILAARVSSAYWHKETEVLLRLFRTRPEEARLEARWMLGLQNKYAAKIFAPVVFLSEGLLRVTPGPLTSARRFFAIMLRLPMELQMIISHRAAGFMRNNIPTTASEPEFRALARGFPPV